MDAKKRNKALMIEKKKSAIENGFLSTILPLAM
jgi:hypothetical protein